MKKGIHVVTTILLALLVSQVIDINNLTWVDYLIFILLGFDIVLQVAEIIRRKS